MNAAARAVEHPETGEALVLFIVPEQGAVSCRRASPVTCCSRRTWPKCGPSNKSQISRTYEGKKIGLKDGLDALWYLMKFNILTDLKRSFRPEFLATKAYPKKLG